MSHSLSLNKASLNGIEVHGEMPGRNGSGPAGILSPPDLVFFSQVLGAAVEGVQAMPIDISSTPAIVYRLWVQFHDQGQKSYILKCMEPGWPDDPLGHQREAYFYRELAPLLDFPYPPVYYAGPAPAGDQELVLMADFAGTHHCPSPTYHWQMADMAAILPAYARLHASGREHLPSISDREWFFLPLETRIDEQLATLPEMVAAVCAAGKWPHMPHFPRLLYWLVDELPTWRDEPPTVLHMDVYPPNVALPYQPQDTALLIDWEMVSFGLAELDLAYMFLQPYRAHQDLDRERVLAEYWRERVKHEGTLPSLGERQARQLFADVLWAVWMIPRAYHLLSQPFSPQSAPGRYWASMYAVLGERLLTLSNTVG